MYPGGAVSVLEFKGVSRVYVRGARAKSVLADISFSIERGDCIALYGANRSGKSTLLRLAVGADSPTAGSVLYGGEPFAEIGERHADLLRSEIAWIPATPDLRPELSVLEQVALARYLTSRDIGRATAEAEEALAMAGIEDCAASRPPQLSTGELRLAALAQGIVKRPRLLVADDPAADLDPDERERVLTLLRRSASELSTAVLYSATQADQTLASTWLMRLSAGRLIVPEPQPEAEVITLASRKRGGARAHA